MTRSIADPTTHTRALQVGDEGLLRIGASARHVVVIEDRGPLGRGGRQIVAVRDIEADDDARFETRAEWLEPLAA